MGAVFGIVLGSIFAFFASFFTPFFGALTGTDSAQVILPYDENKGIVWEYDRVNDPYAKLTKTEIVDDTQIFTFRTTQNSLFNTADGTGYVMDFIFTDKNGNSKKYYAVDLNKGFQIYAPGEYAEFELTVTAEEPVKNGKWISGGSSGNYLAEQNLVYTEDIYSHTVTFTVVHGLNEDDVGVQTGQYYVYKNKRNVSLEYARIFYKVNQDGSVKINSREQGFYDN